MNTSSKEKPYKILFDGEYILAVSKKPGLLVVPARKKEKHTLTAILSKDFQQTVYPAIGLTAAHQA